VYKLRNLGLFASTSYFVLFNIGSTMATKLLLIGCSILSLATVGLTAFVPISQAIPTASSAAVQTLQDSDFFLKRGLERIEQAESGESPEGLADLHQAIKLNPKNAKAYAFRGAYLRSRGIQAGMADLNRGVELSPDDIEIRHHRSIYRELNNDYQGSIEDLSHILKLKPNDAKARYLRAIHLSRPQIKDYQASILDLDYLISNDKAVNLENDEKMRVGHHQARAFVRQQIGDKSGAIADFQYVEAHQTGELEHHKMMEKLLKEALTETRLQLQKLKTGK
jgi:tetratricopeptide (TPR) repeat protein